MQKTLLIALEESPSAGAICSREIADRQGSKLTSRNRKRLSPCRKAGSAQLAPGVFATLALAALALVLAGCSGLSKQGREVSNTADAYTKQDLVAVLLPESGRYAAPARAVRDGILAAQRVRGQGKHPQIRFYDSSKSNAVGKLLEQAAAEGATLAIGPLQKASVATLAGSSALPIPTLALNRAPGDTIPANFYQFALTPENEAAEAANKAWGTGCRSALMLYPNDSWGKRMATGFRSHWGALGGKIARDGHYNPGSTKHSRSLSALFPESAGKADCMFLVTSAKSAQSLWPQIQAASGGGLPVYTTSHIYGGSFDPKADGALTGLRFVDIPWLLAPDAKDPLSRKQLQASLPKMDGRFIRLYAMGIDAYSLAPNAASMAKDPRAHLEGKTGRLRLDTRRKVRRRLTLARMDKAGPVLMAGAN